MSDDATDRRRPVERNTSWLHSKPARRAARSTLLNPIQVIEQAVSDIRDNVRRNLEAYYSSESSPEPELHPNVNIEREFPFDDTDPSIINPSERNDDALRLTYADRKTPSERKVESFTGESFRCLLTTTAYSIRKKFTPISEVWRLIKSILRATRPPENIG